MAIRGWRTQSSHRHLLQRTSHSQTALFLPSVCLGPRLMIDRALSLSTPNNKYRDDTQQTTPLSKYAESLQEYLESCLFPGGVYARIARISQISHLLIPHFL